MGIWAALQRLEAGVETLKLALHYWGQLHPRQRGWDKPPAKPHRGTKDGTACETLSTETPSAFGMCAWEHSSLGEKRALPPQVSVSETTALCHSLKKAAWWL